MASQNVMLKVAGLQTYYQSLMEIAPGALLKANNTVIDRSGIIEPRRGIQAYGDPFVLSSDRAKQLLQYKGRILRHINNKLAYDDGVGVFTDFSGTYSEPVSGYRMKSIEAKQNLYFTTNNGIKKISATSAADLSISNIIEDSGGPKAITGSAKVNYAVSGFLTANTSVAYKILWIYTDRNNNLIFGSPSARMLVQNTTALTDASVDITFQIPYDVDSSSYKYRIYRSDMATTNPSDEMYQVLEGTPTPAELVSRSITITESSSESLRIGGVPLYTNQYSGEGILQANEAPPSARDIALFKGHMFYGNTRTRHTSTFSLLSNTGFTSGTSDFIISDGTTTNTYTFYGTKEESTVTVTLPHASIIPSSYFKASSASNQRQYAIWMDKTGSDTAPVVSGYILIRVNLSGGGITTTVQVATAIVSAINASAGNDFVASNVGGTSAVITIVNTNNGVCNNGMLEGVIDVDTTFTMATITQGTGEVLSLKRVLISAKPDSNDAIEEMAQSLVNVINADTASTVSAYYASNFGETPGKIILQSNNMINTTFYIGTSDAAIVNKFSPELGIGGTLLTKAPSTAETIRNRLYYSKYQEHEAVPLLNYIDIGAGDQDILRIIALRESLFILKGDGVFRLAGDPGPTPAWDVGVFDNTSIIKSPDTAVTLGNECYFFSNQGIVKLNEADLSPISQPIKDKFTPFITTNPNIATAAFAVSYESDRALLVWTVATKSDTYATVCYRYNTFTKMWSEWNIAKTCAVLNVQQDKMYYGSAIDAYVEMERKNFDRFDYADRQINITLPPNELLDNVISPSGFSNIAVNDVLLQEQYVTIYQFNSLLKKLDLDNGFSTHTFYDDLKMNNGDNLVDRMNALVAALNIADNTTVYVYSGATSFQTIQTEFNVIIGQLNASATPYFSNYKTSTGTVSFEAIVTDINKISSEVTLNISPSFMVGTIILYKGIQTEIEYAPQHAGNPAGQKQFSSGTLMFERRSFHNAQIAYNSDISDSYEEIAFSPTSSGIFGGTTWGDGTVWGGAGDQSQLRTYIPLKKQRCRFLGCRFIHSVALESYELYGLSLSVRDYAIPDRVYK